MWLPLVREEQRPWHFRNHPAGHELNRHLSVVIASPSSYKDSGLVVRERAAIRRATPYGMLVDDEYGPSDENAARELVEAYRLVYGMSPAVSMERRCSGWAERRLRGRRRSWRGAIRLVLSESPQLRMSSFCLSVAGRS